MPVCGRRSARISKSRQIEDLRGLEQRGRGRMCSKRDISWCRTGRNRTVEAALFDRRENAPSGGFGPLGREGSSPDAGRRARSPPDGRSGAIWIGREIPIRPRSMIATVAVRRRNFAAERADVSPASDSWGTRHNASSRTQQRHLNLLCRSDSLSRVTESETAGSEGGSPPSISNSVAP